MLDYLDDIASDLSAFHRIDDCTRLDGPTYFRLVWRLSAYTGVMQARALALAHEERQASPPADAVGYPSGARQQVNPGTQASLMADPAFNGIFSFG